MRNSQSYPPVRCPAADNNPEILPARRGHAPWRRLTKLRRSVGLLAVAASLLGAASTFAQSNVYSSFTNIINIPNGYSLIANQLDHGSNTVSEIIPYSDGDNIAYWNGTGWDLYTMDSLSGTGWVDPAFNEIVPASLPKLTPGKGFLYGRMSGATTITFTGQPHVPVLPATLPHGYGAYNLLARQTNDIGSYENVTGFAPQEGAIVLTWNGVGYLTNVYTGGAWSAGAPSLAVGQSAFFNIPPPSSSSWPCTNNLVDNLVVNGGFETTSPAVPANTPRNNLDRLTGVPGWTTTVGNTLEVWGNVVNSLPASEGVNHMEVNAQSNDQTVSQVVSNLSVGCPTKVCFDYTGRFGVQGSNYNNDFTFSISGGYSHSVDLNPPTYAGTWTNYCITFTPTSSFVTLSFRGHPHYTNGVATQGGAHIDDVSLFQCCSATNPPCTVVIDCPTNKTVPCGSAWSFDSPVVVSNSCCATNFFSYTTATNNSSCPVITRTWKIWDNCGNTNFCHQSVTLTDTNPPVFVGGGCTTNVYSAGGNTSFVTPTASSPRPALMAAIQAAWGVTSTRGFDECAVNKWFAHSFTNLPKCITAAYLEIRLKPCGDICGNDAMHLWFTGSGNNNAVFSQYFGGGQVRAGLATNDWCSYAGSPQTFILDLSNLPASGGGAASILPLLEANGFLDVTAQDDTGVDYVKLTVVSCCGNSTKTVECGTRWFFDTPVAVDDCCPNPTVTVLNTVTNGICPKVVTRTWLATDCCGNTNTASQEVTLVDTKPPVINRPQDIKVTTCDPSKRVTYTVTARDACSGVVTVTCIPASGYSFPIGTTTVTCTATDACGNTATTTFNVTVVNQTLTETRQMGKVDCFALPREPFWFPTIKSAGLLAAHPGVNWKKFDDTAVNRPFGASFLNLSNNITCATLEIRLRPNCPGISENDSITLGLTTSNTIAVTKYIGANNPSPGLTTNVWCGQTGCGQTFIIDLAAAGLLNTMNALHQLDIFIQDDTAVDYAKLSYCYCPQKRIVRGWPWDLSVGDLDINGTYATFNPGVPTNFTATLAPGANTGTRVGLPIRQLGFLSNATLTASSASLGKPVDTAFTFTGVGNGDVNVALSAVGPEVTQVQMTLKLNGAVVSQGTLPATNGAPMIVIMHDGVEEASGQQGIVIMHDGVEYNNLGSSGMDGIIVGNLGSSGQDGVRIANIGSSGQDGVSIHNLGSSGQDGVEFFNLGSSGQDGIIVMHDGVEFGLGSSGQDGIGSSGQDGVEFTIRLNNPGPVKCPLCPPMLADQIILKLVDPSRTPENLLNAFNLGSSGMDGVEFAGPAVRMGDLWTQVIGDATASVDGDQLNVTSLDPASTNQCGIIIHLPVITELQLSVQELKNPGSVSTSNGVLSVAFVGNVGPDLVDVGRLNFTGDDDWGWIVAPDFAPLGSSTELYQVYYHGVQTASLTFHGTPHVPVLPISMSAQKAGAKLVLNWSESQVINLNGNDYVGDELRVSPVAPDLLPTALRIANIGSSGQDGVSITASVPASYWRLQPPVPDFDVMNVEWSGPSGGVLESARTLNGPWTVVPGQSSFSATPNVAPSTNGVSSQLFRVRSN